MHLQRRMRGGYVLVGSEINITAYSDALVVLGTAGVLILVFRLLTG